MPTEENMSSVCHSGIVNDRMFFQLSDCGKGVSDRLHQRPSQIFESPVTLNSGIFMPVSDRVTNEAYMPAIRRELPVLTI
jgi:hypothetical protein